MPLRCRLWTLISQAINSLWFNGDPDETLSARAWREQRHHRIDWWLGDEHCEQAFEKQRKRQEARYK
jgi:hypothetical protein